MRHIWDRGAVQAAPSSVAALPPLPAPPLPPAAPAAPAGGRDQEMSAASTACTVSSRLKPRHACSLQRAGPAGEMAGQLAVRWAAADR